MAKAEALPPGQRVRLTDGCVWPERRGCVGVVVAPPLDGSYPQPGKGEALVKLDDDPLSAGCYHSGHGPWTCVIDRTSVEAI